MERIAFLLISGIVATSMYFGFLLALKREGCRAYVLDNFWLHPNAICVWRLILGWIGLLLYFGLHQYGLGILLFTISGVLDGVDGLVARKCNLVTPLGEVFDPLCDKLTYLPTFFLFVVDNKLEMNVVLFFTAIEFAGQFLVRPAIKRLPKSYKLSVSANNFGKIKTAMCFFLIIYLAILDCHYFHLADFSDQALNFCIIFSLASSVFKAIPNFLYADILTSMNFACGIIGIVLIFQHKYALVGLAILAGQIFDLFDGRMADKHGGTKFGPWFDDIADFASFGLCPAVLIAVKSQLSFLAIIIGAIYAFCIGYRLWRFLKRDKKDAKLKPGYFRGLPSPGGAVLALGASLYFSSGIMLYAVVLTASCLLVSNFSFVHFGRVLIKDAPKILLVLFGTISGVAISYVIKMNNERMLGMILLTFFAGYMVLNYVKLRASK
jgi:CDP-diacylglycerol--serine O-phosphatidyltransferase